jgi:hypothetical protein
MFVLFQLVLQVKNILLPNQLVRLVEYVCTISTGLTSKEYSSTKSTYDIVAANIAFILDVDVDVNQLMLLLLLLLLLCCFKLILKYGRIYQHSLYSNEFYNNIFSVYI